MKTKKELEDYYKKLNVNLPLTSQINQSSLSQRIKDYNNAISVELNEELLKATKTNNKVIWILTGLNILIAFLTIYFNFIR